jgi:hypothetical protein
MCKFSYILRGSYLLKAIICFELTYHVYIKISIDLSESIVFPAFYRFQLRLYWYQFNGHLRRSVQLIY